MGAIIENRHMMKLFLETLQASSLATIIPQTLPTSIAVTPFNTNTTLSNGTTITSPLVVVADGRHSKTRELLGIGAKTTSYHQTAIVVTIAHTNPHHGIALEHFLASGPFASLPMAGGYHSSLVWTERDTTAPYYLSLDDNAFLYEIKQRLGDFLGNISLASDRYHYPLALVVADRTIQDRIALVADAAQGIHPIAGQGFNLGIRDIHALTQAILYHCDLGLDIGTNLVLEDYRKRRQLDSNLMISATHLLNGLFCSSSPALRGIRQLGLGVLNHFPYVKKIFMRHAMGELIGS